MTNAMKDVSIDNIIKQLTFFSMDKLLNLIIIASSVDTHLSRFPCSGQWCLGSNSPLNLFSGKKGSLGIPVKIPHKTNAIHEDINIIK